MYEDKLPAAVAARNAEYLKAYIDGAIAAAKTNDTIGGHTLVAYLQDLAEKLDKQEYVDFTKILWIMPDSISAPVQQFASQLVYRLGTMA